MAAAKELTQSERVAVWLLPNVGDLVFLLVLAFLLGLCPKFIFGDGSTGWHLLTGNFILDHGIPHQDLMSFTHPHEPWVAYEWLSDVIMASLVRAGHGDLSVLAVCTVSLIAALMLTLYGRCRREGANFALALPMVLIGAMISAIHWLARPHIATFFGVFFFVTWLEDFWKGKLGTKQLILRLCMATILWVNLHPAFLMGFVLIGIYLFVSVLTLIVRAGTDIFDNQLHRFNTLLIAFIACAFATLINPYGIELHSYISHYLLKESSVLAATQEFMSPVFHGGLQTVCLEVLFALFISGLAISKARLSFPRLVACLMFSYLVLSAVRNMPLYVLVVLPAISQLSSTVRIETGIANQPAWWTGIVSKWHEFNRGFDENEELCSHHLLSIATALVLLIAGFGNGNLFGSRLFESGWNPKDKPIKTLEFLRKEEVQGKLDPDRGFNYDNWGGYLAYRLNKRVFIDDRADFYGEKFYSKYVMVNQLEPGWKKQLDGEIYQGTPSQGSKVQWIIMPKQSRLGAALKEDSSWGDPISEDEASQLFVRKE